MSANLQLKKFDMKQIADDKVVVLIGKRETGKSFLVRDLLYYHQDIPIGTVISFCGVPDTLDSPFSKTSRWVQQFQGISERPCFMKFISRVGCGCAIYFYRSAQYFAFSML